MVEEFPGSCSVRRNQLEAELLEERVSETGFSFGGSFSDQSVIDLHWLI